MGMGKVWFMATTDLFKFSTDFSPFLKLQPASKSGRKMMVILIPIDNNREWRRVYAALHKGQLGVASPED